MTDSSIPAHRPAGVARGHAGHADDNGTKVKRRTFIAIAAMIAFVFFIVWLTNRQPTVEVTIGVGSSPIAEINRLKPPVSERIERKNYLTGIRMAQACNIPVYKTRGMQYRQTVRDRITYTQARAAAGTTDRFLVSVPVYAGDVLSTRGGDRCREAPNTRPFDQR